MALAKRRVSTRVPPKRSKWPVARGMKPGQIADVLNAHYRNLRGSESARIEMQGERTFLVVGPKNKRMAMRVTHFFEITPEGQLKLSHSQGHPGIVDIKSSHMLRLVKKTIAERRKFHE